jgi:hypothetical protein
MNFGGGFIIPWPGIIVGLICVGIIFFASQR